MLSASSPPAPAAALIGRAAEVEDVLDLLGRARLVTLTGPPGVGKTRLALAVCADRDDVSWVDLAPIRDPRQVQAELARASRPDGYDHSTDRLVVLDNCEHLLDSDLAGQLAELLRSTARPAGARHQPGTAPAGRRARVRRTAAAHALGRRRRRSRPPARQPGRGAAPGPGAARRPAHAEHRPRAGRDLRRSRRAAAGDRAGRRAAAGVHAERARVPARPPDERADQRTAGRPGATPRPAGGHRLEPRPALRARPRGLPAAVGLPGGRGTSRAPPRCAPSPTSSTWSSRCWTRAWSAGPGRTPTATPGSRC